MDDETGSGFPPVSCAPRGPQWLIFCSPMKEHAPDGFPPLTLLVMRALCALTILYEGNEGQDKLMKALDALYHDYWFEHKKTNEKDVLAEILSSVLGDEDSKKGRQLSGLRWRVKHLIGDRLTFGP